MNDIKERWKAAMTRVPNNGREIRQLLKEINDDETEGEYSEYIDKSGLYKVYTNILINGNFYFGVIIEIATNKCVHCDYVYGTYYVIEHEDLLLRLINNGYESETLTLCGHISFDTEIGLIGSSGITYIKLKNKELAKQLFCCCRESYGFYDDIYGDFVIHYIDMPRMFDKDCIDYYNTITNFTHFVMECRAYMFEPPDSPRYEEQCRILLEDINKRFSGLSGELAFVHFDNNIDIERRIANILIATFKVKRALLTVYDEQVYCCYDVYISDDYFTSVDDVLSAEKVDRNYIDTYYRNVYYTRFNKTKSARSQ